MILDAIHYGESLLLRQRDYYFALPFIRDGKLFASRVRRSEYTPSSFSLAACKSEDLTLQLLV